MTKENLRINKINEFIQFLVELENVYNFEDLEQYSEYLKKIIQKFEKNISKNEEEINVKNKYFEALTELEVIEKIYTKSELWGKNYFSDNISANLLKLFLKYLDKKAISLNLEEINETEDEKRYSINSFNSLSETVKENIAVINLQDDFPKIKINNFLFSKIQRANFGLPVSDDEKQIEIFKFYQNIFGAEKVYLSYVKNYDEKMDSAGVIEEIKLKYNIEPVKNEISEEEQVYFIKKYFLEKDEKYEKKEIGEYLPSKLEKNLEKIQSEILSLGYYKFVEMKDFEYGFYLDRMIGNCEIEEINDKIDSRMFGNIIHQTYEKIVSENREEIEKGTYKIDSKKIRENLEEIILSFKNKIPKEYIIFYEKISFEEIVKAVEIFLTTLTDKIKNLKNVKIKYEEKIKNKKEESFLNYENVRINGVADLHLISDEKEILFDYKSGKDTDTEIKKAFSQLDYYDILLSESGNREKWVINTWDGQEKIGILKETDENGKALRNQKFSNNEFGRDEKDVLKVEEVKEILERYFNEEYYDLGKKTTYSYIKYKDVCRREEEKTDDRE